MAKQVPYAQAEESMRELQLSLYDLKAELREHQAFNRRYLAERLKRDVEDCEKMIADLSAMDWVK